MDWDINVEGVSTVLTNTQKAAEPFNGLAKTYGDNLNNLMVACKWDVVTVVAAAIGEYAQHWGPTLESAAKQVGASLTGAQNAVTAYMNGQEEMAQNAQRMAARGETPETAGTTSRNRAV